MWTKFGFKAGCEIDWNPLLEQPLSRQACRAIEQTDLILAFPALLHLQLALILTLLLWTICEPLFQSLVFAFEVVLKKVLATVAEFQMTQMGMFHVAEIACHDTTMPTVHAH